MARSDLLVNLVKAGSRGDLAQRVFICSRYAGDIEHNVRVALALCRMAVEAGLAPFAPHLLFTQFLDDGDPAQREVGISLGLRFMEVCDVVWVYLGEGVSDGMRREMVHAQLIGKSIVLVQPDDIIQALALQGTGQEESGL